LSDPPSAGKIFPGTPLRRTNVDVEYNMDFTGEIHLGPKPLAYIIARIGEYSTLSNSFSKSIFRIMMGFF
jgi:hypothetical protein